MSLLGQNLEKKLRERIIIHEGKIPHAYQDSKGWWTIGIGRLIDKRKGGRLTDEEMEYLLSNDLEVRRRELRSHAWYNIQDEVRKGVLVELAFNMGVQGLLTFQRMIAALRILDYATAGRELVDSKWARQDVGAGRVADVRYRLETGKYK